MHCTSTALLHGAFGKALQRSANPPASFLIPSFSSAAQTSSFSTTSPQHARKDGNPNRGVSALRRTGMNKRQTLSVSPTRLPKPVPRSRRSPVQVDPEHGLWDFFNHERASMSTPSELAAHGRGWTVPELRNKDWEDLWRLWWVCIKEKNRCNTMEAERKRAGGSMYGQYEMEKRVGAVKATQRSIRHVLTERWYAWENARVAAMDDREVNLYADPEKGEPAYLPMPEPSESAAELDGDSSTYRPYQDVEIPPPAPPGSGSDARV